MSKNDPAERTVRDIRRKTRKQYTAEEKIRIVVSGLASPLRLKATGAHDRNPVAARHHPPSMAGPAVCRQSPEVGAGWFSDHVRICAGDAQQCAFLPQPRGGAR